MKLPHKINPVHCASKDETRYSLNSVSLQGDLAVATDGRTLFAVKGEREKDDDERDATIPKRAAAEAWPQRKKSRVHVLPSLTINPKAPGGQTTVTVMNNELDMIVYNEIDGTFPNIEKVIPDTSKYTKRVGLNVKLLLQIAKCFGEDKIAIYFDDDGWRDGMQGKPMIITSKTYEAFGILMPCPYCNEALNGNQAMGAIHDRVKQREDASKEAAAAEEAAALAKAESECGKTAEWMAANSNSTPQ